MPFISCFVVALVAIVGLESISTVEAFSASTASKDPRFDTEMETTYDALAQRCANALKTQPDDGAVWIAITGGPGSGKSTLAEAVSKRLNHNKGSDCSVVVPMDGYHYTQKDLIEKHDPVNKLQRRGAPWTFDAESMFRDLVQAKQRNEASLPGYSRDISDPVPDAVKIEKCHKVVFVEGLYLLLGSIEQSESDAKDLENHACRGCPRTVSEEVERWKPLRSLWNETWMVFPGLTEQRQRLVERSLKTWTPAKTEQWGGGMPRQAAERRADSNDMKNAALIERCQKHADLVIDNSSRLDQQERITFQTAEAP